jgi:hypothetical protein
MTDVKDSKTRAPQVTEKWEYPYAHIVWRGQDGSVMGFCEKNGYNAIFMQHGVSGSYSEINNSGDMVNVVVGNQVTYGRSGATTSVDHNNDTKQHGHVRTQQQGGIHIVVVGDAGIDVAGNTAIVGQGPVAVAAKQIYMSAAEDIAINAGGNFEIAAKGTVALHSGQQMGFKAGGTMAMRSPKINMNGSDEPPKMAQAGPPPETMEA